MTPPTVADETATSTPPSYPFATRAGVEPDPQYGKLRGAPCPVLLSNGRTAWLVTRMDDVRTVHTDARFSRQAAVADASLPTVGLSPPAGSLLALDPPDHSRIRRLVAGAFSARRMDALRPRVTATAHELLRDLPAEDEVDLVAQYTRVLSARVVGDLLGVPAEDQTMFSDRSDALLSTATGAPEEIGRARGQIAGYLRDLLQKKAKSPAEDLLSHLASQHREANGQELVMLAMAVLVAGHETTTNLLASSLWLILTDDELADRLRRAPDQIPAAGEEMLRLVSLGSVGGFPRVATVDLDLGGVRIRQGEPVIAALNAANRDPEEFTDPDSYRPGRPSGTHVAFGAGPHFCLGAALARIELTEGIAALLTSRPEAVLTPQAGQDWHRHSLVRGLVDLPVLLGPALPATAGLEVHTA